MSLLVKVCGMRDADNIRAVEALGIDMMGFIFWPPSSRFVSQRPSYLPTQCKRVGVFVDAATDDILQRAADYRLDIIQLHGHESPEFISQLASLAPSLSFIKAFNIATPEDFELTRRYEGIADYFLFDAKGKSAGGNGTKFDWALLDSYTGDTPFLLSGGIGPEDNQLVRSSPLSPKCIGIDLNSRFESEPGIKEIGKLKAFLNHE